MTQDKDPPDTLSPVNEDVVTDQTTKAIAINNFLSHPTIIRGVDIAEKKINNDFELRKEENNIRQYEATTRRNEVTTQRIFVWTSFVRGMVTSLLLLGFFFFATWFNKSIYWGVVSITPLFIPLLTKILDKILDKK